MAYDQRTATIADPRFQSEPWREIGRLLADGRLSAGGFAGNLVSLVDLALAIADDDAVAALESLDAAERALAHTERANAVEEAVGRQDATLTRIEALVAELAEWDNFQNVLQLTRDILNRQRTLRERTESFAKEEAKESDR